MQLAKVLNHRSASMLVFLLSILIAVSSAGAQQVRTNAAVPAAVMAQTPYMVSVFAQSVPGQYTAPDSITYHDDSIFIGYGDGNAPDGSDGKSSNIVEYGFDGSIRKVLSVKGHNDGLKVKPGTHELWAVQNEDGNANLVIYDIKTWSHRKYQLGTGPHGGGYDDIVFRGDRVYLSASNPLINPNTAPAIVELTLKGGRAELRPTLLGNSTATDIPTGNEVTLNLQDPDSMTTDFAGDLVLDSQADGELIFVAHPGALDQSVYRVLLTVNGASTTVDDTYFITRPRGVLLVADTAGDTVYAITKPFFTPGSAFSASDSGGFVGELDVDTGVLTPVVSGMVSPHGMRFIPEK